MSYSEGGLYGNDRNSWDDNHTCDACRVMGCTLNSHTGCHFSDDHKRVQRPLVCELCHYARAAINFEADGSWLCTNCHALSEITYSSNPLVGTQQDPVLSPVSSQGNMIRAENETISSGSIIPKQGTIEEDKLESWLLLEPDSENENLQACCNGSSLCSDKKVNDHYINNLVDDGNSSCRHQHHIPNNFHPFGNESDGITAAQSFQIMEQQQQQLPFYGASEAAFTNTPPSSTVRFLKTGLSKSSLSAG